MLLPLFLEAETQVHFILGDLSGLESLSVCFELMGKDFGDPPLLGGPTGHGLVSLS